MPGKSNGKRLTAGMLAMVLTISSAIGIGIVSDAATAKRVKSVTLKIGRKMVTKKTYSLVKGRRATIKVGVSPKKAKKSATFKSSNKKVASVSKGGVVTAKKTGTAKISVVVKGKDKKSMSTWVKIKVKARAATTPTATPEPNPIKTTELKIPDGSNSIYGKLYTPEKEGVYPAIIMCHGYNGINDDFVSECRYFAQNGYVAYAFDFCGGSGRSKSSGKTTDMTIFTERDNLIAVFNYIKTLNNVDKERIFLHGGSQGGLVAGMAAVDLVDEVKGMILYFPAFNIPDNWRNKFSKVPETYDFWGLTLGKVFFTSMKEYDPFDHIGKFTKNVLILHGKKDVIVSSAVVERAKATYPHCELITYPNDGHGFTPVTGKKAMQETLKFMQKQ